MVLQLLVYARRHALRATGAFLVLIATTAFIGTARLEARESSPGDVAVGATMAAASSATPQAEMVSDRLPSDLPGVPDGSTSVLYDQYNNLGHFAAASQNFEPGLDAFDSQGADNFAVPSGQTWVVDQVEVSGSYRGSGVATSVNVYIYTGSGSLPGTPLVTQTNLFYTPGPNSGDMSIRLNPSVTLPTGTYWLSVQANQNYNPDGQWFWRKRMVVAQPQGVWRNPGQGFFGPLYADWSPACYGYGSCSCLFDFVFRIDGSSQGIGIQGGAPHFIPTPAEAKPPALHADGLVPALPSPVMTQPAPLPATPSPTCGPAWRLTSAGYLPAYTNRLWGIGALSENDVWAVGESSDGPITEHWNGLQWSAVTNPGGISSALKAVAGTSGSDVWAVGRLYYGIGPHYVPLVEHWNGTQWSIVTSPELGPADHELNGLSVLSSNDVWAVGSYSGAALILHWNGVEWSVVNNPSPGGQYALTGVEALAANNVWTAGYYNSSGVEYTLIEHWDGVQWRIVSSPNAGISNNRLNGIAAASANDLWAVGDYYNNPSASTRTLVEHWNGTQWSIVPSPFNPAADLTDHVLASVAVESTNNVWAVGYYANYPETLVQHWDGTQWSIVPSPNGTVGNNYLYSVSATGSGQVWAAGWDINQGGNGLCGIYTLAEVYDDPCGLPTYTPTPHSTVLPSRTVTPTVFATRTFTRIPANTPTRTRTATPGPCVISFADVFQSDYFYDAVRYLYCHGIISGYADNTFRPYNNTTRSQLCKIVVLGYGLPIYTPPSSPSFIDVPTTNPFYTYVETAYHSNLISGYADGTFRPGAYVTRGQLVKIVTNAAGWPLLDPGTPTFQDVERGHAFYQYVETAYSHGIISGYDCGTGCLEFRPSNNAYRSQIAKIVYLALVGNR